MTLVIGIASPAITMYLNGYSRYKLMPLQSRGSKIPVQEIDQARAEATSLCQTVKRYLKIAIPISFPDLDINDDDQVKEVLFTELGIINVVANAGTI